MRRSLLKSSASLRLCVSILFLFIVPIVFCLLPTAFSQEPSRPVAPEVAAPDAAREAVTHRAAADAPTSPALSLYQPAASGETEAFLKEMTARLSDVRSMRAEFIQERRLSAFLDTLTAKGVCWFEAPAKIRWELTEPYVSILIHNENRVAKFDLENGQLRKMRPGAEDALRETLGQIMAWMRGDFKAARGAYDLGLLKGKDCRLVLTPRTKGMKELITSIELAIDPATFRATAVTIREAQGDSVEIRFRNERINPALEASLFDLQAPKYPAAAGDSEKTSPAPDARR